MARKNITITLLCLVMLVVWGASPRLVAMVLPYFILPFDGNDPASLWSIIITSRMVITCAFFFLSGHVIFYLQSLSFCFSKIILSVVYSSLFVIFSIFVDRMSVQIIAVLRWYDSPITVFVSSLFLQAILCFVCFYSVWRHSLILSVIHNKNEEGRTAIRQQFFKEITLFPLSIFSIILAAFIAYATDMIELPSAGFPGKYIIFFLGIIALFIFVHSMAASVLFYLFFCSIYRSVAVSNRAYPSLKIVFLGVPFAFYDAILTIFLFFMFSYALDGLSSLLYSKYAFRSFSRIQHILFPCLIFARYFLYSALVRKVWPALCSERC